MTTKGYSAVDQRLEGDDFLGFGLQELRRGSEPPEQSVAVFAEYQDRVHCCEHPLSDRLPWAFFGSHYCSSPIGFGKRCTPLDDH
jgi:hypothetical protein